ncbi:transposase [Rhodococcus ruber]|uniref:transposase n=1 Tax=Rhodococcus ruber TaxID=1830 RepID=UPI0024B931B1|nr:transposase [Rhodococcus ruber]MDJ0446134.1 transposase [Rhodococcus ruber]
MAELKDGPLAHLPSGKYAANAAWLAHAVIAFNLARAAGVAASPRHARARWATLRTHLINIPARIASSARRMTLHLPTRWPWEQAWRNLFDIATGPPTATTS